MRTHQLLLAILGASQTGSVRRAVLRELAEVALHRGRYRESAEELTPLQHDPMAAIPTAVAALATLTHPRAGRWLADGAVSAYALSPAAWRQIIEGQAGV